jgi:hypothetical protein
MTRMAGIDHARLEYGLLQGSCNRHYRGGAWWISEGLQLAACWTHRHYAIAATNRALRVHSPKGSICGYLGLWFKTDPLPRDGTTRFSR